MLPKAYRLKRKSDFKKAYQQGKSIANQYLVLYVLPQSPQAGLAHKASKSLRVGFSVSKKSGVLWNGIRLKEDYARPFGLIWA